MIARCSLIAAIAACTTNPPPPTCGAQDLVQPPRTEAEVRPILARSCALGGCHLRAPGAGGLVLDTSSAAWVDAVVGVASRERAELDLVVVGAPADSWLVQRLDGCGGVMPPGDPLSPDERAAIVGWIGAGAPR